MATYILIHGAAHGGWCWHKVVPLLEAAGHKVIAPDLLGLGADLTPVAEITLQHWVDQVAALVEAQSEPVVLVGHSRGGLIVSEVAERLPERIVRTVYLTAFLLADGQTLGDVAASDETSMIPPNLVIDEAEGVWLIKPEAAVEGFFADCSSEDLAYTFPRLRPEPLFSLSTPIRVTGERFGRVPRTYIECLQDRAITIECQRRMQAVWPCSRILTLDTAHSPFMSAPRALTDALLAE
jgi:pimeloyl-ACP methyl ester carboxylesterase